MSLGVRQRLAVTGAAAVALSLVGAGYLAVGGGSHRTTPAGDPVAASARSTPGKGPTGAGTATAGDTPSGTAGPGRLDLTGRSGYLFVNRVPGNAYGSVGVVAGGTRTVADVRCERVYTAPKKVLCLREIMSAVPSFEAVVLDDRLRVVRRIPVAGLPSRARLSADGAIASWTVFAYGDSYLSPGAFATRTSVLDLRSGRLVASLESFTVIKDGRPYTSPDVNFWGVTVARDDRTFYATMSTRGRTYLVRGDLAARTVATVRDNVECPSLSPDGTRIVFKKRVDADGGRVPWRLVVLDLASLRETPLAEQHTVDDQAVWLDDAHVAYALPVPDSSTYDVWSVPADGSGTPSKIIAGASSPAPLRGS
jgi:hypothetical protein